MVVLILLVAMVSTTMTSVSASSLRKLHPKPKPEPRPLTTDMMRDAASRCVDDPDWRYKGISRKSCDWIGEKEDRKVKKCKQSHWRKNCKETCGKCGMKKCPKHVDSDKFEESCKDYKDGLECFYDYSVIGCAADGSDTTCNPGTSWTCGDDFQWRKDFLPQIQCISDYEESGKKCDPETYKAPEPEEDVGGETPVVCPDFVPTQYMNCERNGPTPGGCFYNYEVDGCTENTLVCLAIDTFFCADEDDGKGMIWKHEARESEGCGDGMPENWPSGACDPNEPVLLPDNDATIPGVPKPSYCPLSAPQHDQPCTRLGADAANPDGCEYNHIVTGCNLDDLWCIPIESAHCEGPDPIEVCKGDSCRWMEETYWATSVASILDCGDQPEGSPWSHACDPLTFAKEDYADVYSTPSPRPIDKPFDCPERRPRPNDHCKLDGITPPNGCPYGHVVTGCTQGALGCRPIVLAECVASNEPVYDVIAGESYDGIWQIMSFAMEECTDVPRDWPAGGYCDPSLFDASDYLLDPTPAPTTRPR